MFNNLFGGGMGGMGGPSQGGQRMKFNMGGGGGGGMPGGGGIEDILMGGVCSLYAFSRRRMLSVHLLKPLPTVIDCPEPLFSLHNSISARPSANGWTHCTQLIQTQV